ncbi:MAG TPA: hypothetical protein DDW17_03995 [Deltaproteobacteria bacterium]|nr:hypothetical protein [Deltaproteobacteria bacterium]
MKAKYDINAIDKKIKKLRKATEEVMEAGGNIEAVKRNTNRILASIKMLELNVCDVSPLLK